MKIFCKKVVKNLHTVKTFSIFVMSERLKSNPDILKILKYAAETQKRVIHLLTKHLRIMKNVQNNPETAAVEAATVENAAVEAATVEAATAETPARSLSPIEKKAAAVLRAKLPHLSKNGLNFEKRTGNFFRATIQTQDDGTEKVSRLVVADADIEGMTDALAAEMSIKRAAARILSAESDAAKLEKKIEEVRAELAALEAESIAAAAEFNKAVADVEAYELPEKAARETLSAKVVAAESKAAAAMSENERLRAMLIAAGLDPDKM